MFFCVRYHVFEYYNWSEKFISATDQIIDSRAGNFST